MSKSIDSSSNSAVNYNPPSSTVNPPASWWHDIVVGSVSAIAAVAIVQPMIYCKNVCQRAASSSDTGTMKKYSKNPGVWYRGVAGFAASFAPTVALQTGASGIFAQVFGPFCSAVVAGGSSAAVVGPAEIVMIQQQKTGQGFWQTAKQILANQGIKGFARGMIPTAIRESIFTGAYLGAAPSMKKQMESSGVNGWVATFIAGGVAGSIAAVFSHPFDTYKTQKQSDFGMTIPMYKAIFQKSAFAGLGWRVGMVITATTVMPVVQEKVRAAIEKNK